MEVAEYPIFMEITAVRSATNSDVPWSKTKTKIKTIENQNRNIILVLFVSINLLQFFTRWRVLICQKEWKSGFNLRSFIIFHWINDSFSLLFVHIQLSSIIIPIVKERGLGLVIDENVRNSGFDSKFSVRGKIVISFLYCFFVRLI